MSTSRDMGSYQLIAAPPTGRGRLFIWLGPSEPLAPVENALKAANARCQSIHDQGGLAVWLEDGEFGQIAEILDAVLKADGLAAARAIFVCGDADPTWRDLAHARPLADLVAVQRAIWLLDIVDSGRLTSHFQPIVHGGDTSRVFAQEALLRALDGENKLVPPYRMFGAARAAGLLPVLDEHARLTAIREASRHGLPHRIFINLNPASIRDPRICLAPTLELIQELGIPRNQIVFELVESDHSGAAVPLEALREWFREEGFLMALDDLGSGYSSLNLLHRLRPDFVKMDMDLVRNVHEEPYKARITSMILQLSRELDIETIAEGVETAGELRWLRGEGATYLQGYLIAKPSSPPILSPPALGVIEAAEEPSKALREIA